MGKSMIENEQQFGHTLQISATMFSLGHDAIYVL